ncbi:MAG: PstS family phosphate ABC transporter substrate-binding protein [Bacteroidales bacterium]|jgi:phosphate transport system substrate-binding protein|nr:PstS family phosphate ABC transporter substrate-binding protein [Bacteroidales bacterium]
MKKILVTIGFITITMLQTTIAQRIKGSDTVLPLAQKESESYMKARPGTKVTVTGGGSGVGIAALISGTTDIAMASRNMKFDEKAKIQQAGKAQVEKIIAYDALAVVVHPSNKVSQLTRKQLEDIFTGKITNWKQVGGADMSIVVYSRETSSGTYEFFKEHVMLNKNYKNSVLSMPATGAIIQSVSQTKGAIGYVGLAYLNKEVKALKVSYDGKTYVAPSFENAKNKTYPVVRPLFFYYEKKSAAKVTPFIDYVLSPAGQKIVAEVGYIPVK